MGIRLAKGTGIARDEVRALMWLTLAARQAHAAATKNRKKLARKLSPEQRAEAGRLADGWAPKGGG